MSNGPNQTNQEVKDNFERYEALKIEAKKIECQLKELQPLILAHVPEGVEVQLTYGKIYTQARTTWEFSPNVEKAQAEVDELKKEEKAKGIATGKVTQTLYYKEETSSE